MLEVYVIREGKNFGDHYDVKSSRAFSTKKKAVSFLESKGFKKTSQGTGDPLWVNEESNSWAEPVKLTVDKIDP